MASGPEAPKAEHAPMSPVGESPPSPLPPRWQFTIRELMIVIAVVGFLLATRRYLLVPLIQIFIVLLIFTFGFVIVFVLPALTFKVVGRLARRWLPERATIVGFAAVAATVNVLYLMASIEPGRQRDALMVRCGFWIAAPTIGALGMAWLRSPSRSSAASGRWEGPAKALVFGAAVLPLVTAGTSWPLRLAFLIARPELNALADQALAGRPIARPGQVGPYRFTKVMIDPESRCVALLTGTYPTGPSGFVRLPARGLTDDQWRRMIRRPGSSIFWSSPLNTNLGWGWSYREGD